MLKPPPPCSYADNRDTDYVTLLPSFVLDSSNASLVVVVGVNHRVVGNGYAFPPPPLTSLRAPPPSFLGVLHLLLH